MKDPPIDYLLAENNDGNTPLHEAVIHKRDRAVEILLGKIQDYSNAVSKVNKKGKSPLYLAVEAKNAKIVHYILNRSCGTSQNGTSEHVNANVSVPHAAITGNSKRIANPSSSSIATPSQTRVDEDVEPKKCILHVAITRKDTEGKCAIVEIENVQNSKNILNVLDCCTSQIGVAEHVETTKSVLHAAVAGKDIGILRMVAKKEVQALPDNTVHLLHLAASLGFLDGVKYLLDQKFGMDVLRHDEDGFCPIHLASKKGHLQVTKVLLDHYPDAREFLSKQNQNILHVAAENGKDNIVEYILKTKWAEFLINEKDKDGYTPLHLATKNWHPKIVSVLTWDPRIDLKQVNEEGLTALELAEKYMEVMAPFKKRLTWIALRSAGTPRTHIKDRETVKRLEAAKYEPYNMDYCKSRVNTLLLVAALVATVTFAAGFTMPGGYNSSDSQHAGMVTMQHKTRFRIFVICDSIAVYSSIIVTVMLMWAQLGDLNLMLNALRKAQRLLGLSLGMMSLAFLAGVNLVVTESHLLSIVLLVMGIASLIILVALFVPLFLPYTSKLIIFRYISYYPFKGLMLLKV
ncbi:putative ankyrin repeat-containing domain, PGG domain, ankyrin repeat-containing domain superfamily [Helianthus annuus]|nr:putative ankyrin repeat-containing domain, PGG domain, ankyrin repeat-containing domain superfamily [Helianthus annuus]